MTPLVAFILGLLIGLLVEWIIDWLYWRRRQAALQTELEQVKAKLTSSGSASAALDGQMATLKADFASLQQKNASLEADKAGFNQQLSALASDKASLAEQLEACRTKLSEVESLPTEPDDLVIIKGIGPVINRQLNQAGIYTFKQLASLTPAGLREIVGDVIERLADEESILAQAAELAAKKKAGG